MTISTIVTNIRIKSLFILFVINIFIIQNKFTYISTKKYTNNISLYDDYRSYVYRPNVGNYYKYFSNYPKVWSTEKSRISKNNELNDEMVESSTVSLSSTLSSRSSTTELSQWQMSDWSECSVTCGTGIQTRHVNCVYIGSNSNVTISSIHCPQPMPLTVQNCKITDNCLIKPKWRILSDWSECSVSCGKGIQKRIVCCFVEDIQVHDTHCDPRHKPVCEQVCDVKNCEHPNLLNNNNNKQWLISSWSNMCSNDCGYGIEKRRVICFGGDNCDQIIKPKDERSCCSSKGCSRVKWFYTDWSQCSSSCGTGIQKRDVLCLKFVNSVWKIVDDSQCETIASTKPSPLSRSCLNIMACSAQWFVSEWSHGCVNGLQSRTVLCLSEKLEINETCSRHDSPATSKSCSDVCSDNSIYNTISEANNKLDAELSMMDGSRSITTESTTTVTVTRECGDQLPNCNLAKAANLCDYQYYRKICCFSCAH